MKKIIAFLSLFIIVLANPKGNLFIVGGGNISQELLSNFVDLAGGKDARIVIIPIASEEPLEAGKSRLEKFKQLGCTNVKVVIFDRNNADSDSITEYFDGVKGVFFGGGDQNKITNALLGTKLLGKIFQIYENGGVIGGTSAGAAIMSKIMLTGNELVCKDTVNSFSTIMKRNVEVKEGLGFVNEFIVDQHFVKRKRHNRLLSVLLDNPDKPCVGIDEATAVIYHDGKIKVVGESNVIIYKIKDKKSIKVNKNNIYSAKDIEMQLLVEGDEYSFRGKK
jgi:cyanophycinase